MAELIEMPFGMSTQVRPRNNVVDEGPDAYTWLDNFCGQKGARPGHDRWFIYSRRRSSGQHQYGADADYVYQMDAHLHNLENKTEQSVCGGDAAYVKLLWPRVLSCLSKNSMTEHTADIAIMSVCLSVMIWYYVKITELIIKPLSTLVFCCQRSTQNFNDVFPNSAWNMCTVGKSAIFEHLAISQKWQWKSPNISSFTDRLLAVAMFLPTLTDWHPFLLMFYVYLRSSKADLPQLFSIVRHFFERICSVTWPCPSMPHRLSLLNTELYINNQSTIRLCNASIAISLKM